MAPRRVGAPEPVFEDLDVPSWAEPAYQGAESQENVATQARAASTHRITGRHRGGAPAIRPDVELVGS